MPRIPAEVVVAAAACAAATYLLLRAVLAVLKFRRCELAIPGPPSLPILGNARSLVFANTDDIMERLIAVWGHRRDISRISVLHNLFVFVSKPEDMAAVMKRKDLADKARFMYSFMSEVMPSGLVMLNGPKWKMHRVASTPAFHPKIIENFVDLFAEEAEKFNAGVEPCKEFLIQDKLLSTTMWSFCRSVMMSDTPTKEQEECAMALMHFLQFWMKSSNERFFNPLLWSQWVYSKTKQGRMVKEGFEKVRQFCRRIFEAREIEVEARNGLEDSDYFKARKTLLEVLLEAHRRDEQAFPREDILDELLIFLTAATETSVSSLNFTFKMLSLRPDIQQKVYEEVNSLLGSGVKKRSVVAHDLPKLEYTERVMKEVMRLFATVPFIARQVKEDTGLCGRQLPKGATIVLNIFGLHRDPETWPDPLRFDPDRFLPEQSKGRHPYAYVPFSGGLRNCIGESYAWAGMKSVLATTIRDYFVEPADDGLTDHTKFKLRFDLGLKLLGGVRVKLIPRTATTA